MNTWEKRTRGFLLRRVRWLDVLTESFKAFFLHSALAIGPKIEHIISHRQIKLDNVETYGYSAYFWGY